MLRFVMVILRILIRSLLSILIMRLLRFVSRCRNRVRIWRPFLLVVLVISLIVIILIGLFVFGWMTLAKLRIISGMRRLPSTGRTLSRLLRVMALRRPFLRRISVLVRIILLFRHARARSLVSLLALIPILVTRPGRVRILRRCRRFLRALRIILMLRIFVPISVIKRLMARRILVVTVIRLFVVGRLVLRVMVLTLRRGKIRRSFRSLPITKVSRLLSTRMLRRLLSRVRRRLLFLRRMRRPLRSWLSRGGCKLQRVKRSLRVTKKMNPAATGHGGTGGRYI